MKRALAVAVGGVVLLAPLTLTGCSPATACSPVSFIANSDSGAAQITAYGVACSTARALAVKSRPDPANFSAYAFNCKGTHYYDGLPHTGYVCLGPSGKGVTFNLYY